MRDIAANWPREQPPTAERVRLYDLDGFLVRDYLAGADFTRKDILSPKPFHDLLCARLDKTAAGHEGAARRRDAKLGSFAKIEFASSATFRPGDHNRVTFYVASSHRLRSFTEPLIRGLLTSHGGRHETCALDRHRCGCRHGRARRDGCHADLAESNPMVGGAAMLPSKNIIRTR